VLQDHYPAAAGRLQAAVQVEAALPAALGTGTARHHQAAERALEAAADLAPEAVPLARDREQADQEPAADRSREVEADRIPEGAAAHSRRAVAVVRIGGLLRADTPQAHHTKERSERVQSIQARSVETQRTSLGDRLAAAVLHHRIVETVRRPVRRPRTLDVMLSRRRLQVVAASTNPTNAKKCKQRRWPSRQRAGAAASARCDEASRRSAAASARGSLAQR
jgi:hypothetical protein